MAESQSDERLAQELNPQTETGMLGPTWLPASELSFREKMRSGAQAQQQQNNLPIIDQLAQSAMMPQGMPQQMPPQQMPPQQMPPQQMMPQEPMPQGMPPQMMSAGGLLNYANGGQIDVGQRVGPLLSPDDLYKRIFQDYYDPTQVNPDQLTFPRDTTYDTDLFGLDKYPDVNVPSDRETLDNLTQELLNRQTDGKTLVNEPDYERTVNMPAGQFGPPISFATNAEAGTANTNRDPEPLTVMGKDQVGGGISGIDPDDIPNAGNLYNNYPDLEETLTERAKARGAILPGIISGVKDIGQKTVKGYLDYVGPNILAAEGLDPDLYDPDWVDLVSSDDKKTTEKQDEKKPTETKVLTEIQKQAAEGGLPANTYYDPVNDMIIDKATGKEFDGGVPKGAPQIHGPDGTEITSKVTSIESDTTAQAVQDDVMQAEQQRLDELKDQIFKGNMDRKWMAIAAGAFNAAQKGSPTLMQGLADLGGGVTQELQKMDKEDQDRAMALYEIYIQEATLKESKRKTDLTYSSDMAAVISKMTQAGIDNKMEQLKYLLESGADYADIAKSVTQGMIGEDYQFTADILHSKIGNPSAQIGYNQHLSKLENKEIEIISKIQEETGENYDPENSEHKERAEVLYDEFLSDNPGLREIRSDYWSGANQSDWVTGTLIL